MTKKERTCRPREKIRFCSFFSSFLFLLLLLLQHKLKILLKPNARVKERERDKLRFLRDKEMDEKRRRSGQKALNVLQCIFKYLWRDVRRENNEAINDVNAFVFLMDKSDKKSGRMRRRAKCLPSSCCLWMSHKHTLCCQGSSWLLFWRSSLREKMKDKGMIYTRHAIGFPCYLSSPRDTNN